MEWGTGRAGPWARGPPRGGAEGGECPDLRHPRWNRHGHGETGGSCLLEGGKKTKQKRHYSS